MPAGTYRRLLGLELERLPAPLRTLHGEAKIASAMGRFDVSYSGRGAALLLPLLFGMPPAAREIEVRVTITRNDDGELWERDFAGRQLVSSQRCDGRILSERFGLFECDFALRCDRATLTFHHLASRLSLFGQRLPLPSFLAPHISATETATDEAIDTVVTIAVPLLGKLRYSGRLGIVEESA